MSDFNPDDFGLKKDYLYEVLASTFSLSDDGLSISPNTACMGIKLGEENCIKVVPFPSTSTYKNLMNNKIISVSFVDNVYLYALAALKSPNSDIEVTIFPTENYNFQKLEGRSMDVPYIKASWAFFICEVERETQKVKSDQFGEVVMTEFMLNVLFSKKLKESFKLYNRADNLALEAVIHATRLKLASSLNDGKLFDELRSNIKIISKNIDRFGGNIQARDTMNLINKYIETIKQD